jgi:hypothetical protein
MTTIKNYGLVFFSSHKKSFFFLKNSLKKVMILTNLEKKLRIKISFDSLSKNHLMSYVTQPVSREEGNH